jgi:hypothetical protein
MPLRGVATAVLAAGVGLAGGAAVAGQRTPGSRSPLPALPDSRTAPIPASPAGTGPTATASPTSSLLQTGGGRVTLGPSPTSRHAGKREIRPTRHHGEHSSPEADGQSTRGQH